MTTVPKRILATDMNVKRFTARTSRDALILVRQSFGDDAVVLSTKPCADGGVEVVAMANGSLQELQQSAVDAPPPASPMSAARKLLAKAARAVSPSDQDEASRAAHTDVTEDVSKLSMSTLSFQDYVRERMLRRRQAVVRPEEAMGGHDEPSFSQSRLPEPAAAPVVEPRTPVPSAADRAVAAARDPRPEPAAPAARAARAPREENPVSRDVRDPREVRDRTASRDDATVPAEAPVRARRAEPRPEPRAERAEPRFAPEETSTFGPRREPPVLRDEVLRDEVRTERYDRAVERRSPANAAARAIDLGLTVPEGAAGRREQQDMMSELRSMKGLIEERFGALAFMEKMQRQPAHMRLTQKLLDCGFSPVLIRKLTDGLTPDVADEVAWAANVLERNLITGDNDTAIEDQGGVVAMIGSTGVGKTTTTAKIAAAFATRHGASHLGLITLDAYRVGAHEQLRAYGRILGVPVYTAHDRATLEDLLDLLSAKKMVLIDTAGIAQRDSRTAELLDMLGHRSIEKLLVVNAASQGETIEDVLMAYRASNARGVVLSKMDEAVKLAPALDAMIRHKVKVVGVANGQRVPEDWHRLSSQALVQRALRAGGNTVYRMEPSEVNIVFGAPPMPGHPSLHAPSGPALF